MNATSVGSNPDTDSSVAVDWASLATDSVVADVIIDPSDTRFLQQAKAAGATTVDGTGMLVNHPAENMRLRTGVDTDRIPMRAALDPDQIPMRAALDQALAPTELASPRRAAS